MLFNLLQPAGSVFASGILKVAPALSFLSVSLALIVFLFFFFPLSPLHRRCLLLCLLPLPFWGA